MIKQIIFDLDGTLLNTLEDIHYVLNVSLQKFGLPCVTIGQTKSFVGNGARRLIQSAVGDVSSKAIDEVCAFYSKTFSECENERTKLYDKEEEVLSKLSGLGIKFAIVTNKPQRATDNVYVKFLAKYEFNRVLGQTEYYPLKPNPASTLAIIDDFKLKKDECIFVGDGETDVLTAKAAGIKCISALWGYRSKEQLKEAGAEIFAENYCDLFSVINSQKL